MPTSICIRHPTACYTCYTLLFMHSIIYKMRNFAKHIRYSRLSFSRKDEQFFLLHMSLVKYRFLALLPEKKNTQLTHHIIMNILQSACKKREETTNRQGQNYERHCVANASEKTIPYSRIRSKGIYDFTQSRTSH